MHDIRAVRADPAGFDAALARRGLPPVSAELLSLDAARRAAQTAAQEAQARRNALAREIGQGRKAGADTTAPEAEATALRDRMEGLDAEAAAAEAAQRRILEALPNLLDPEVPEGRDETSNVVLHQHGAIPNLPFAPRQHFELGESLGGMDFATATKLSGSRFTVLRGPLARLERAIGQWMLNLQVDEHGYTETVVPLLVNDASMHGTGQLPKFADDLFRTTDGRWLIPTAEVPLTNTVRDEIVPETALPIRLAALSPCFRSEAGSAGRDTRGMIRQHQFSKVEMVSITTPDASAEEHERMTRCAERVLTELGLVWRRVLLCAGDTGFGATKTYDLEVWLPGQGAWREISSCSNCRDFQARRMNARMKPREGKGNVFLHTLNGSGVAVGRALVAVMETHQREDGSITIPPVLRPFMGGAEAIPAAS
ncbi:serine--tRNA ligase [Roseomonas nepalensis]|uniref:Serine--tRNA ligase n=1 Tax=Muricoccus nepalensis TaxID=1854500 RepID=A0A502G3D8_9PROT|nr:serine--tRNA ligase [Roseomonas nepalensis]TPG55523.1 serine--tRNA ligase [Roseomonas nepalensis]